VSKLILAVDDETAVRRLVQINLERRGFRVNLAVDGVEGLASVRAERPDLVILDVTMPQMDGIEMLRRMKADPELAPIPVIMLTARVQDQDIFEGKRSGAAAYLPKPFSPPLLFATVEQVFAQVDEENPAA
jgi:CheY-like chemotaxis protein